MNIFGMVSTSASRDYTPVAISTFFSTYAPADGDTFVLLDNDVSLDESSLSHAVEFIRNPEPASFAENVNKLIPQALESECDLFFLNNDVVFSKGWMDPLIPVPAGIVSPLCNQQIQYRGESFSASHTMRLEEYRGHEEDFEKIAAAHRAGMTGFRRVLSLPFFCTRFSFPVLRTLGFLDVTFGRGGAEDNDYCLRAALAGFPVLFACASYVLHFSGRSTWAGAESDYETQSRVSGYRKVFEDKWGPTLRRIVLDFDNKVLSGNHSFEAAVREGDLRSLILLALENDGKEVPPVGIW